MSRGGGPSDLVEHARVEGVDPRIGEIARRVRAASPRSRRPGRRVDFDDPALGRPVGARNTVSVATAPPARWASTSRPQVEVGEVVGVARRGTSSSPSTKSRLATQRAGAAEQLRLVLSRDDRGRGPGRDVGLDRVGEVVGVDEHLVDSRARRARRARCRASAGRRPHEALRASCRSAGAAGCRARRRAGRPSCAGLPDHAERAHPRVGVASTSSRPGMSRSHSAYSATDSAGVLRGAHPSCFRASMSEQMCRVSPNRYSPLITAGRSDP